MLIFLKENKQQIFYDVSFHTYQVTDNSACQHLSFHQNQYCSLNSIHKGSHLKHNNNMYGDTVARKHLASSMPASSQVLHLCTAALHCS